jgi:putative transposase
MEQHAHLEPGKYYHIINRGITGANIFLEERDYAYFLSLYAKHVESIAETFAYCLLRNHFHLLVRIKPTEQLTPQAFSNFFNSYAKGINKTYARTGSLFEHRFGRLEVTSERYGMRLLHYIHFNPQKHGFVTDFRQYPYSSYRILLAEIPPKLNRAQVLDWFGGRAALDAVHQTLNDDKIIWSLIGEDLD